MTREYDSVGRQCTPGLVADVRSADTPEEASSSSKTIRKGAEREAHFTKHKRTAYKVFEIVLENKLMENEDDFEGLEEKMWFLHECRKSENAIASENVLQSKETLARIQKTLKNLSELIEKHKQVHKEKIAAMAQILKDDEEKLKQEKNKLKEREGTLKEKERLLDAKTNFPAAEVTILNLALSELNREAEWYKDTAKSITGQSDAVSEVMLEKIRRGEKIPNLPKGLESYQDLCSRLRGIGHVPTAVEESIQWEKLLHKHKIALLEIERLETMVKIHEDKLECIRKEHDAHKPSTPALVRVGRSRTEPPISAEEDRKRKRNKQSSQRKSRELRQMMKDFHSTPTS